MIGSLRQLSEPRLRPQAGIEKSQTPVERDILVQWVRKNNHSFTGPEKDIYAEIPPIGLNEFNMRTITATV